MDIRIENAPAFTPDPFQFQSLEIPLEPSARRNLRDVIPAGKGRFSDNSEYLDRIRSRQKLGMKSALRLMNSEHSYDIEKPSTLCVVGGGPSLADNLAELRHLIHRGAKVIAVNKTHDWLIKRGIPVHYATLLDPKDWVAGYIDPELKASKAIRKRAGKYWADTKYLIASQCHDDVLARFKGRRDAYLYHAAAGLGESQILNSEFANKEWICIAGGSVVGLRAICLGYGLGFRKFHTFGLDGSAKLPTDAELKTIFAALVEAKDVEWLKDRPPTRDEILEILFTFVKRRLLLPERANAILRKYLYSYAKPHIDNTWSAYTADLKSGWSRSFISNHHMARSVYEFEDSMKHWDRAIQAGQMEPFNVYVHGDPEQSAIALVAAGMGIHANKAENEKYGKPPH